MAMLWTRQPPADLELDGPARQERFDVIGKDHLWADVVHRMKPRIDGSLLGVDAHMLFHQAL